MPVFTTREVAGASGDRHSLRHPITEGGMFPAKLARMRGERVKLCFVLVARSEDWKQSILFLARRNGLLRFARNDDLCCLKFESARWAKTLFAPRPPCQRK